MFMLVESIVSRSRSAVSRLWFGSQPVSFERINSRAILAVARIPVQIEFFVGTRGGRVASLLSDGITMRRGDRAGSSTRKRGFSRVLRYYDRVTQIGPTFRSMGLSPRRGRHRLIESTCRPCPPSPLLLRPSGVGRAPGYHVRNCQQAAHQQAASFRLQLLY